MTINKSWRTITSLWPLLLSLAGCAPDALVQKKERLLTAWDELLDHYQQRQMLVVRLKDAFQKCSKTQPHSLPEPEFENTPKFADPLPRDILQNLAAFRAFESAQTLVEAESSVLLERQISCPSRDQEIGVSNEKAELERELRWVSIARSEYMDSAERYNATLHSPWGRYFLSIIHPDAREAQSMLYADTMRTAEARP